ncbi:MAG TPA: hypothetical protein ENK18_27490 [Deltaproteobacteria bacterium]|nr:hypothetical protein [Deltaproteobacteria bacterium]
MERNNPLAATSMVCGVVALGLMFTSYCLGILPYAGWIALLLMPVEWALAFVGLLTGILGYRTAAEIGGAGRGSALSGVSLSAVFMVLQALLWTMACFGMGTTMLLEQWF